MPPTNNNPMKGNLNQIQLNLVYYSLSYSSSHCVLYGHAGPVYGVDSASKGHYLLSASEDTSGM